MQTGHKDLSNFIKQHCLDVSLRLSNILPGESETNVVLNNWAKNTLDCSDSWNRFWKQKLSRFIISTNTGIQSINY